jgi:hypothetical protein
MWAKKGNRALEALEAEEDRSAQKIIVILEIGIKARNEKACVKTHDLHVKKSQ